MTCLNDRLNDMLHMACTKIKTLSNDIRLYHLHVTQLNDSTALLEFECWQSTKQNLSLGSVKHHLHVGSIGGVEASRMEVVLDVITQLNGLNIIESS